MANNSFMTSNHDLTREPLSNISQLQQVQSLNTNNYFSFVPVSSHTIGYGLANAPTTINSQIGKIGRPIASLDNLIKKEASTTDTLGE